MSVKADEHVPVLIAGGSLVGLSASLFLGRLDIRHLLVEKHPRTSQHPRGRGNNVRTMEIFRTAGVEPAIREAASVLADNHGILQAHSLTGTEQEWLFKEIDPGGALSRFSPTSWCLCSQNDLEPVLVRCARELGGDLRFGTELLTFEQDATGVTAVVCDRETGRERTVRAQYLIAADGPRSPIRERLGIDRTGRGDLFHNVSITFRSRKLAQVVGRDRRFIACYLRNPAAEGTLLPVDNQERWVFHAPWRPQDGQLLEEFTDERCAEHIRTAIGDPDLDVEITGRAPWHAAERVAVRYRVGRVLLAGDSAHEMSPTGAFGSNTGIQDAHNLAWKLAAVLRGWAGPDLLDSYGAERQPVAQATSIRASARSTEHKHPGYHAAPSPGRQSGMLATVLGYRYCSGAVVGADPRMSVIPERFEPNGEPGSRAPHMWLHCRERLSTLDLYERSMVLLCGPRAGAWHAAGHSVAERLAVPLDCHIVGTGPDALLLPERGADWAQIHGAEDDGAVLVRPDGFVAWRAPHAMRDPDGLFTEVLESVLSCDRTGEAVPAIDNPDDGEQLAGYPNRA